MKIRVSPLKFSEHPGKWRFRLEAPLVIEFKGMRWGDKNYVDRKGNCWVKTRGSEWEMQPGYMWDGSSPTFHAFGRHWGTPDFRHTIAASCWHDASGQCRHNSNLKHKLGWWTWNRLFRDIIVSQGGRVTGPVYHLGLIVGNPFYQALGSVFRAECSKLLATSPK